jgi:multiple sugar transport system permease protein
MAQALSVPGTQSPRKKPWASRRTRREWLAAYGFIAPYVIVLTVFTLIAVLYSLYLSFFRVNFGLTEPVFAGLHNFRNIWFDLTHDGDFGVGMRNALIYTAGVVTLQTVLALALALLLNQKVRALGLFRTWFYLPALTSSVAISLIFIWLYQSQGAINYLLSLIHIHGPNWLGDPSTALLAIMLLNIWTTAPTFMIVFLAGLQSIPQTLYEAARVDGAGAWRVTWNITIPLLRPVTFVVVALGIIGGFQAFDQVYLMTNGGPLRSTLMPAYTIFQTNFQSGLTGLACAEAFVLFVVIFAFTVLARRYLDVRIEY